MKKYTPYSINIDRHIGGKPLNHAIKFFSLQSTNTGVFLNLDIQDHQLVFYLLNNSGKDEIDWSVLSDILVSSVILHADICAS